MAVQPYKGDRVKTFQDWQEECFKIADEHGWHEKEITVPEIVSLLHSEITELYEAFKKNDMDNFIEEMADIAIRNFDHTKYLCINLTEQVQKTGHFRVLQTTNILEICLELHNQVSRIFEHYRNQEDEAMNMAFGELAEQIGFYANMVGINLDKAIEIKCEVNRNRSYRHGNKRC
jgi:NTP pyrophosphatase (non-canonical NTP hydrolase)